MSISTIEFETPLGPMRVIADEIGVRLVDFNDRRDIGRAVERALVPSPEYSRERVRVRASQSHDKDALTPAFPNAYIGEGAGNAELARSQLVEYFAGTRTSFDLPLNPQGTDFQRRVWDALQQIPFAQTRSYTEQTLQVGPITALRAVAQANGQNFLAIVIPCHRVIGASGDLRGYGGGLARKRWLIDHECAVAGTATSTLFATR